MAAPAPVLRPGIGFCLQTETTGKPAGRWYVNMCKHKLVEMPVAHSGKTCDKEWILKYGIGSVRVPFDMGSFRKLKERSDGARHTTFCIDVVFNPLIVQLFSDDDFCNKMDKYRPWLVNLAFNRIEEQIGVKLSSQKVKLVKSVRYKDSEDESGNVTREFTELPGEKRGYGFEDEEEDVRTAMKVESAPTSAEVDGPLIEDVTPASQRKPAMKKGFLNKKDAAGSLYGEGGSKEGVLPENAGDPMGYLPKSLRKSCKIVDCNSPEYQAHEKKQKEVAQQNKMNEEFRNELLSGFDFMQKNQDKWEADLPDGIEDLSSRKYDNDYSRFDSIKEEPEEKKVDDRDWYYDTSGQRRQIDRRQPEATGSQPTGSGPAESEADPAVKKGFLSSAKKSLYGPEGSTQAKNAPTEAEMMKQVENIMGKEMGKEGVDMAKMFQSLGSDPGKGTGKDMGKDMASLFEALGNDPGKGMGKDMGKDMASLFEALGNDPGKGMGKDMGKDMASFFEALGNDPSKGMDMAKMLETLNNDPSKAKDMASFLESATNLATNLGSSKLSSAETPDVKAPVLKAVDFKLDETSGGLQLVVSVPDLRSMEGVDLDVIERKVSLDFPSSLGYRPLHVELPVAVDPTAVRAKFSKKSRELTVTLPRAT